MMPPVNPECVTHHNACACRERRFKRMEEVLREVQAWSERVQLPYYEMKGWMALTEKIQEVLREEV
jgi:hypothetical protein